MKTLEEIEAILNHAFDNDSLVKIVLMPGLGVEYNREMIFITYPKLEFGMPQQVLCGVEANCEDDGYREFITKEGYKEGHFDIKLDEIEDCQELPWLLYSHLYP